MKDEALGTRCPSLDIHAQVSRRAFLLGAGATVVWLSVPGCGESGLRLRARVKPYPAQAIARLSELEVGQARPFTYPFEHPSAMNFLIRLGQRAGGGVGPNRDIVAFNSFCTHQGGPLAGLFRADLGVAGPCPLHWTTFDLTRHGMVVSGHATLGLPQILLRTEGDDVIADGVMGLLFGHHDNRAALAQS